MHIKPQCCPVIRLYFIRQMLEAIAEPDPASTVCDISASELSESRDRRCLRESESKNLRHVQQNRWILGKFFDSVFFICTISD